MIILWGWRLKGEAPTLKNRQTHNRRIVLVCLTILQVGPYRVKDHSKIILPFFLFDFSFSSICLIIWKDKYPQININGVISMKTKLNVELSKNSDVWNPKRKKRVLHLLNFTLQDVSYTVTYSESSQVSNLELFVKIVDGFQSLPISTKGSMLDV